MIVSVYRYYCQKEELRPLCLEKKLPHPEKFAGAMMQLSVRVDESESPCVGPYTPSLL